MNVYFACDVIDAKVADEWMMCDEHFTFQIRKFSYKMNAWLHTMDRAIELSEMSIAVGGGPFGAVIVKDGQVIGEGHNKVVMSCDPTAHAEVLAIRNACQAIGSHLLAGCAIYTSCEPCPMCLSACYWAGIDLIYYANNRKDAAAIGFDDDFIYDELTKPLTERRIPIMHMPAKVKAASKAFAEWAAKTDKVPY